jgi:hypothetical protein
MMEPYRDTIQNIIFLSLLSNMKAMEIEISVTHCEILARCVHMGLGCAGYEIIPAPKPKNQAYSTFIEGG